MYSLCVCLYVCMCLYGLFFLLCLSIYQCIYIQSVSDVLVLYVSPFVCTISLACFQEYIMVMVANNKTKEQVAKDLETFLGTTYAQEFADWYELTFILL